MSSTATDSIVSLHERCQYPNKQCPNRRFTKRNGQLHRFCEHHREKATRNQQRWLQNRRQQTSPSTSMPPTAPSGDALSDDETDEMEKLLLDAEELDDFFNSLILTPEELQLMQDHVRKSNQKGH